MTEHDEMAYSCVHKVQQKRHSVPRGTTIIKKQESVRSNDIQTKRVSDVW
jgi:hypothetical protein